MLHEEGEFSLEGQTLHHYPVKKIKQKREYEMALIEQDLSAESKTSAYDLYLSRPQ